MYSYSMAIYNLILKMVWWQDSSMNATEYKNYHESYMSNNRGTTAWHVFFCILFMTICTLYNAMRGRTPGPPNILTEYFTIVLPLILAYTILADYLYLLLFIISFLTFTEYTYYFGKTKVSEVYKQLNTFKSEQIETISCLRGLTYLITVFAILGVDFNAFPKVFAKTEKFGYSLMDTGVGLFTLMSGLVHKDLSKCTSNEILRSNFKFISVLTVLGVARFWSVKALDYHEHITEYGLHWNFFFTLAVCKFISTVLLCICNRPLILFIILLAIHEYLLYIGLQKWVFSKAPRTDLMSANREGISSCLGYTALYLFAVYIKGLISNVTIERYKIIVKLLSGGGFCWLLLRILNISRPISRVLANSAYCMYLCAILLSIMALLYSIECLCQDKEKCIHFRTPFLLSAINYNGLLYFLVGNLLTGAVNLSMQTLFVPKLWAIIILNVYMILNLILVVFLKGEGIKI